MNATTTTVIEAKGFAVMAERSDDVVSFVVQGHGHQARGLTAAEAIALIESESVHYLIAQGIVVAARQAAEAVL